MSANSFYLLDPTKKWNSQPLNCKQSMSAFLSKPHFAYPHGSVSRRRSAAGKFPSLRRYSNLSAMDSLCGIKKMTSLLDFTSFQLGSSGLSLTLPNFGRRSLAVRSVKDIVHYDTEWTPLLKACISQGGEFPKLLFDMFTDLSSDNFLYSLTLLATILGGSGAFYAYGSRENGAIRQNLLESERISEPGKSGAVDGWLELSRGTSFSRFVTARCPSLAPSVGVIIREDLEAESKMESEPPEYQRFCLHAHDGGTVALDWPSHLDLEKNKELDIVLLIIPGSTEGSEEKGVVKFTRVAEQQGYFPVVLNPRGCGGSPLTTPRVFSAADSDDVRVAAHYIAKRRPWATIMGIGWGFGANMLAKYLGEEAYATPLTAAVCIDNPYNLDKVTQSVTASRWNDLDQALTNGLVKILDANKNLFLGESKGFDVSGGLAATSLFEFETAISRVAHGYETLQKFYEEISSEATLDRVQIPLLCIQHVQDYIRNQIPLPRRALDNNPYIMLLVSPSSVERLEDSLEGPSFPGIASEWSHGVALEWLAAVEIALLKGRHPLLNAVDLTVKPVGSQITAPVSVKKAPEPATTTNFGASHTYDMVDGEIIDVTGDVSDLSEISKLGSEELSTKSSVEASEQKAHRNDSLSHYDHARIGEGSGDATREHTGDAAEEYTQEEKRKVETERSSDVAKEQDSPEEVERGQVQLAADSVMKVLDVTMPGTLSAEQKQQVLEAVGRGETLVGALQEAVPEDVRGKMVSAVSAAVQSKDISLKTAGFGEHIPAPNLPAGLTESLKARLAGLAGSPGDSPDHSVDNVSEKKGSDDQKKVEDASHRESPVHESSEGSAEKNSPAKANSDGGKSNADLNKARVQNEDTLHDTSEYHADGSGTAGISSDHGKMSDDMTNLASVAQNDKPSVAGYNSSQATNTNSDGSKSGDDLKKDSSQVTKADRNNKEVLDSGKSQGKQGEEGSSIDSTNGQVPVHGRESDAAPESKNNGVEGSDDHVDEVKGDTPKMAGQEGDKQEPAPPSQNEINGHSSETSDSKADAVSPPKEEAQQKSQNDVPTFEAPAGDQVSPVPSVGQALQALTGFDDATQMAVTNVFGVVENVLDQLEKDQPPVDKGSTAAENDVRKEENRRKISTNENAHESGDSGSEDESRKDIQDMRDAESHEGHDKKTKVGIRSSVDQILQSQENERRQEQVNGQFEDHGTQQEVGNESTLHDNASAEIRLFADKGEQKFGKTPDSSLVDIQSSRNFVGGDNDYQHHPERSVSPLDKRGSQAQTSAAYPDDGNDRKLAAIAAEIDLEDENNGTKLSEEKDIKTDADGKDTNSGGEKQNVVRDIVMNALKLEVVRRLGGAGLDALGLDLQEELSKVAHAVSESVKQGQEIILDFASSAEIYGGEGGEKAAGSQSDSRGKLGILNGDIIVRTLGAVLGTNSILGRLIPLGVLVGVVLAALGAMFLIVTDDQDEQENANAISTSSSRSVERDLPSSEFDELASDNPVGRLSKNNGRLDSKRGRFENASEKMPSEKNNAKAEEDSANSDTEDNGLHAPRKDGESSHGKIVGAVTAAMGATAAVASQSEASTSVHREEGHSSDSSKTGGTKAQGVHDTSDGDGLPKFVPEIAEKAISMVSPVVPKKEDGEVDQDRLVAMLTEVGQKGGILALVGKAALLWGGLRGAMSLVDRLLGFLRMKDRPLQQRLLGFVGMAILLWSPVLVPLLPTLLQQWATKSPNGVADAAAGVGLYGAVFILITIWGKRVRGYDRPLVSYGLQLLQRAKLRFVAGGMAIGVNLVTVYYGINWALGFINFSWGSILVENASFPGPGPTAVLTFWKLLSLIGQSVSMAFIVALVEELLFRAWLQEEIAVDLGYHWAILLSALAFAVVHWSPPAMVGLWFLSVALAGARSRMDGDLSLSIGIHAGIVAAFSVVNLGGLTHYSPAAPAWLTGAYAGNPLAGALGTAIIAALAIVFYPRKQELPLAEDDDYDYDGDS